MGDRRRKLPRALRRGRTVGLALLVAAVATVASSAVRATNEFPDTPSNPGGGVLTPGTVKPYLPRVTTPQCPKLVGQTLEAARKLAAAQNVVLDPITYRPNDASPGTVIEQQTTPARLTDRVYRCAVVVAEPWTVVVPRLVGTNVRNAAAALNDPSYHGLLTLGRQVQQRESDEAPGTIIAQRPEAGTRVKAPTPIYVVLATPRPGVLVPKVVGMMRPDAEAAIAGRAYRGWLELAIAGSRDSSLPAGTIVAQDPVPGTRIAGPTQLRVILAREPAVVVPDLTGLTPGAGVQALTAGAYRGLLRLRVLGERPAPNGHPAGTLFAQVPAPGTTVTAPTTIGAWVAAAPPPVRVPDLSTLLPPAAGQRLAAAQFRGLLGLGATHKRASTARAGTIVDQRPPPETPVTTPTKIEIWIAEAAPPPVVTVPNLVDSRPRDAKARLAAESFGGLLSLGDVREREADKPEGVIVDQKPAAGAKVSVPTRIDVWVAAARLVVVPDLSNLTREGALVALTKAGLTLGDARTRRSGGQAGSVIGQNPEAGRRVPAGTAVGIVLIAPPAFWKPWHAAAAALVVLLALAARIAWRRWRVRLPGVAYRAGKGAAEVTLDTPEHAGAAVKLRASRGPHETYTTG